MNKKDIILKLLFGHHVKLLVLMSLLFLPITANAVEKVSVTSRTPITMSLKKQQSLSIQGSTIHNAKSVSIVTNTNQTLKQFTTTLSCKAPAKKGAKGSCNVKLTLIKAVPLGKYTLSLRDAKRKVLAVGRFEVKADAVAVAKSKTLKKQQATAKNKIAKTAKLKGNSRKKQASSIDKKGNAAKVLPIRPIRKQHAVAGQKAALDAKRKSANKRLPAFGANKKGGTKKKLPVFTRKKGEVDKTLIAKNKQEKLKRKTAVATKQKEAAFRKQQAAAKKKEFPAKFSRGKIDKKQTLVAKQRADAQKRNFKTPASQTTTNKKTTTTSKDKATEIAKKTKATTNVSSKKPNAKIVDLSQTGKIPVVGQRQQGNTSSDGVSTQALVCTGVPSLSTQGLGGGNIFHPGDPIEKLVWSYEGCVSYFQMCYSNNVGDVYTNSLDPNSGCGSYAVVHVNASNYKIPHEAGPVLSGNEKLFALRACVTGTASQDTECGDWSNSIALKVALPTAVLIGPGTQGSPGNRVTSITTRQPNFSWQSVSGANRYKLVLHSPGPGGPRQEIPVNGTSINSVIIPANLGNRVVWFVKACKGSGSGEFCSYLTVGGYPDEGYDIWQHQHILDLPPATGGETTTVTFNDLRPAFEHSRCQNCHSVAADSYEIGGGADGIGLSSMHQNVGASTDCMSCHASFLTPVNGLSDILLDWQASLPSHVFAGASPDELCSFGKTGAGGHTAEEHLTEDRLILWAIYNGAWTGHGSGLNAVTEWKAAVHDWASAGMPCN
jgi:hypothetical protein